jgi:dTDP-4-amino-4,6-dideoxygalactose transaminase
MTTGEGGMITTNSDEFYHLCSSIRSIGIDTYSGKEVFTNIGSNNRMAEIESILGLSQLNRLDEFVNHRIDIASIYKNELREFEENGLIWFQKFPDTIRHPYWKFVIFLNANRYSRDAIKQQLAERGINAEAPYQPLMHLQPVFRRISETKEGDLPKSEAMSNTHICLPIHVKITQNDARKISYELKQVLSK